MFTRILICSDGSEHALSAARKAAAIAQKFSSEVILLSVFSPPAVVMPFTGGPDVMSVADSQVIGTLCDEYHQDVHARTGAILREAGVSYEFRHELGEPGETIVEITETVDADLVAIGSRGNGGLKRLVLGSVSDHVAHHVHCAVLIVR